MRLKKVFCYLLFECILLFAHSVLNADCSLLITAGPEVYRMHRWREGGIEQSGRIDGVRFEIERFKSNSWYAGFNALLSSGQLNGRSATGRALKSEINDQIIEGRLGFTFQSPRFKCPFITPYGGYGYFCETNAFEIPSPITFTFADTFNYVCAGFLSGFNFSPLLSMGLNFEVRFMLNGKSKVSDDPIFDQVTLIMNNETHYRLEAPFSFCICKRCESLEILFVPFYEFRHFGGREGFPFDFKDTKFSLLGARLALGYQF